MSEGDRPQADSDDARSGETEFDPAASGEGQRHRILVIANETVEGEALLSEIRERCQDRTGRVLVIAPALTTSRLKEAAGDVDDAVQEAEARLERSLETIRNEGVEAEGRIGDSDPERAAEDSLRLFDADEVIVSTHTEERSRWMERGLVERLREKLDLPITHVIVDLEGEGKQAGVAHYESRQRPQRDRGQRPENTTRWLDMPTADRAAMLIAIVGVVLLSFLALTCDGLTSTTEGGASTGCAIRLLILAAAFPLALWHTVALTFFSSVRERQGAAHAFIVQTINFGFPPMILASLIAGLV